MFRNVLSSDTNCLRTLKPDCLPARLDWNFRELIYLAYKIKSKIRVFPEVAGFAFFSRDLDDLRHFF
jgi:hypothetical protein